MNTTTRTYAGPNFSITWADRERGTVNIRVQLVQSDEELFADYRRDSEGHWWALTQPMTSEECKAPNAHLYFATPLPIDTKVYGELNMITSALLD